LVYFDGILYFQNTAIWGPDDFSAPAEDMPLHFVFGALIALVTTSPSTGAGLCLVNVVCFIAMS